VRQEFLVFQSPSRWGRCCITYGRRASRKRPSVSVPFSMGTVLHLFDAPQPSVEIMDRFSPLLDGDGVASHDPARAPLHAFAVSDGVASLLTSARPRAASECFSPLLDGDGVASPSRAVASSRRSLRFSPLSSLSLDDIRASRLCIGLTGVTFRYEASSHLPLELQKINLRPVHLSCTGDATTQTNGVRYQSDARHHSKLRHHPHT
jgi:hypothetical protein